MIVKLIKDCEINGAKLSKGTEVVVPRQLAIELCQDEKAVAEIDIPCEERQKKAAKKKSKKKTTTEDLDVNISNEL